jgi:hypothetical protein
MQKSLVTKGPLHICNRTKLEHTYFTTLRQLACGKVICRKKSSLVDASEGRISLSCPSAKFPLRWNSPRWNAVRLLLGSPGIEPRPTCVLRLNPSTLTFCATHGKQEGEQAANTACTLLTMGPTSATSGMYVSPELEVLIPGPSFNSPAASGPSCRPDQHASA